MSNNITAFTKMHGAGNDFIIINAINQNISSLDLPKLAQEWCQRNFGIGADGLVIIHPSMKEDIRMQIINADGSEPEMCGNAIRCVAKFVYEEKIVNKTRINVETLAGTIIPEVIIRNNHVEKVKVDMGEPILERKDIPITGNTIGNVINEPISLGEENFYYTGVSMGNPHAVIFVDEIENLDLSKIGPLSENHELFPQRINTEFVKIHNRNEASFRVWERGAGETMACGTGACAVVVAGVLNNRLERKTLLHLPGGDLQIEWMEDSNHVMMTGPAKKVFQGEIQL